MRRLRRRGTDPAAREARSLVEAAHDAQKALARLDQRGVDRVCEAMAEAACDAAGRLGEMAVGETGFGLAADKRETNRFASETVWERYRHTRTVGVVSRSRDIVEIANPRGVVAGFVPSTAPTATAIFEAVICVKSRNALVVSPHPAAARSTGEAIRVMREAGEIAGLPPGALSCLSSGDRNGAKTLMGHDKVATILGVGGEDLARAARSSGKPAICAGPANVPVFVERTADAGCAAESILSGVCFDNGLACASEQSVVVDAPVQAAFRAELRDRGAYFLDAREAERLGRVVVMPDGGLDPAAIGRSAREVSLMARIDVPRGTRCLVVEPGGVGRGFPLSAEKLSPILAFYVARGEEQASHRCVEVLEFGGMGHTAGVHTRSRAAAVAFAGRMPASRVVVNTSTSRGATGLTTALDPSLVLGRGALGGDTTSDNISPLHLMDVRRVAFGDVSPESSAAAVGRMLAAV